MPRRNAADARRDYGTDEYWIDRYEARARRASCLVDDVVDETDEWLLDWQQLRPLLAPQLAADAKVIDLGCGTSALALDMLRDHLTHAEARVLAIDLAPAAISAQRDEQRARMREEHSAARLELACGDAATPGALTASMYDACIDKSTTDGLLCNTRTSGAERVRRMWQNVAKRLRPAALVAVVSWRDPEREGLEWLVDLVLGGLQLGSAVCPDGAVWTVDVHSIVRDSGCSGPTVGAGDESARGPHVYLLRRRPRRTSPRLRAAATRPSREAGDEQPLITLRQHVHEIS